MKQYSILITLFVLTAMLMTGCGCTGPTVEPTEAPTVLPTNEEVIPTTRETTQPTTEATTEMTTVPTQTSETVDRGNGPAETSTEPMESTGASRAKMR